MLLILLNNLNCKAYRLLYTKLRVDSKMQTGEIEIGKYTLEWIDGRLFITITGDGEGGEFSEEKLEAAITHFYTEHF